MTHCRATQHDVARRPNLVADLGTCGRPMVLRAMRDVRAGEELCVTYIDVDLPRSARQQLLRKQFCFTCACPRCVVRAWDFASVRTRRRGSLPGAWVPRWA